MKHFLEIDVSTRPKNLPLSPNYTNDLYSSKIALTKKNTVSIGRKSVCTSRIKNIEEYLFTMREYGFHFKKYLKISKKMMSTGRNAVHL